jgi:hypothetical protein
MSRRTSLTAIDTRASDTVDAPIAMTPPAVSSRQGPSRIQLLGGTLIAIGIAIVGALAMEGSRSTPTPLPIPVAAPPTASCPSVTSFLEVIASHERQARWALAASTAQAALRTQGLCGQDRTALGQKLVALSREALFEQPPAPEDAPGQRRIATAYADLKTVASQYGVEPPPPLPIAQSAYDNRLFLLATAAYGDAFRNGDSSTADRAVVRADYAAQYNLGHIWAQRADVAQHQEGLARLATACTIGERNQLNSPEACNELQLQLGSRTRWPAPLADPLLDTPMPASPARGY